MMFPLLLFQSLVQNQQFQERGKFDLFIHSEGRETSRRICVAKISPGIVTILSTHPT